MIVSCIFLTQRYRNLRTLGVFKLTENLIRFEAIATDSVRLSNSILPAAASVNKIQCPTSIEFY